MLIFDIFFGGKIQKKVYIYKLYNIQQNCWRSQLFFLDLKIARNSFVCWLVILNKYAKFHSWHFRHFPWLLFFRAIRKILLIIHCPLIFVLFHLNVYKKKNNDFMFNENKLFIGTNHRLSQFSYLII